MLVLITLPFANQEMSKVPCLQYFESYSQMHRFVVKLCLLAQNASPARSHAAALFFGGGMPEVWLVEAPPMLPRSNVSSHPGPCALATRSAATCCTAAVQATMLFSSTSENCKFLRIFRATSDTTGTKRKSCFHFEV